MWDLSSPTRDWTHILHIARQILNHWTTEEVPRTYSWKFLKCPKQNLPNTYALEKQNPEACRGREVSATPSPPQGIGEASVF